MTLEAKFGCLIVAMLAAMFVLIWWMSSENDREHAECDKRGGHWVIVWQYYQQPVYVKAGTVMVPVGGGVIDQWGCR